MNILIVESDKPFAERLKEYVEGVLHLRGPVVEIATTVDTAGCILTAPDREFELVICARNVANGDGRPAVEDNGHKFMVGFIAHTRPHKVIILTDKMAQTDDQKFTYILRRPETPPLTLTALQMVLFRFFP